MKMDQKIHSLYWKSFQRDVASSLQILHTENNFSDVTLVSDDQIQIQAHKIIISACSPVLKNILVNNNHSHPIIYLRGVKNQELHSILQFIYFGEVKIAHDRINEFLDIAKDLELSCEESIIQETDADIKPKDENDIEGEVIEQIEKYSDTESNIYDCKDCEMTF